MTIKNPREVVELYDELTSIFPGTNIALSTLFDVSLKFFTCIDDKENIKFCLNELNGYSKEDTKEKNYKSLEHRKFTLRPCNDDVVSEDTKINTIFFNSISYIEYQYHNSIDGIINHDIAAVYPETGKVDIVPCFTNYHSLFFILDSTKSELRKRVYSEKILSQIKELRALSLEGIHPLLIEKCGDQFSNSKYLDSIRHADALLEEIIRKETKDSMRTTGQILRDLFTWHKNPPAILFAKLNEPHWEEAHNGIVYLALALTNISRKNAYA
jgi:hypothetical protein